MKYDSKGRELPDPTPVEMPAGFHRPESLAETIQRMVRTEISQRAVAQQLESFEEAFDFEVGDDEPELAETPHTLLGGDEYGEGFEERLGAEGGERGPSGDVRAENAADGEGGGSEEEHGSGGKPVEQGGGPAGSGGGVPGKPGGGAGARAPSKPRAQGKGAKRRSGPSGRVSD